MLNDTILIFLSITIGFLIAGYLGNKNIQRNVDSDWRVDFMWYTVGMWLFSISGGILGLFCGVMLALMWKAVFVVMATLPILFLMYRYS